MAGIFALITGCGAGGIGQALAYGLRDKGYTVIATLLPHEDDTHLIARNVKVYRVDVTSEKSVKELHTALETLTNGRLNILINNAGIVYTMPAVDTDAAQVEKMFRVNVFGPMQMVHVFHRMLIAGQGVIVNIGSIGGICPYVYGSSYNASKAALIHWGNTLRVEMLPFGVRVVNVISGEVATNILKTDFNRSLPEGSVYGPLADAFRQHVRRTPNTMTPEEYAKGVIEEIVKPSPKAWFWYGNATTLVWFFRTFLPHTAFDWLFYRWFNLEKLAIRFREGKIEGL
ncbi:short chain dehydrogenase [Aspergillus aculeatinus CBS 121060]|uniref:Short chain dehydrogenase n=1 Tax=Aspergillus aculeatinus CBS 121060 TaxID=1448322 RepID=A0ACD1HDM8_9EURO|nr:short chain dehydrogenase [Aspergillus aculeatinus CBS 121060]RAH71712.1 short chain dehydrogenase [Aspergillus aculeatinus CBS 121060]